MFPGWGGVILTSLHWPIQVPSSSLAGPGPLLVLPQPFLSVGHRSQWDTGFPRKDPATRGPATTLTPVPSFGGLALTIWDTSE